MTENITKLCQNDPNASEPNDHKDVKTDVDSALGSYASHQDNQSLLIANQNYQSQELDNLEGRIKRWYLEVGSKKAHVTKLNRIDIEVSC